MAAALASSLLLSCGGGGERASAEPAPLSVTPPVAAARDHATATLLPDGKLLVAGGLDPGHLASAELYDPALGVWRSTGSMAVARAFHTATLLPNGKVLVAGGLGVGGVTLATAELYDPASGTWSAAEPMTAPRREHTATRLPSGELLVAGGRDASGQLASAELYDGDLDTWTATGDMRAARVEHAAVLLPSGNVLVLGGTGGAAPLASAELYDVANGTWVPTGDMGVGRRSHTATLLATGEVLAAGGHDGSGYLASAEVYDPDLGSWAATGIMTSARGAHTASLLPSGKLMVAGGRSGAPPFLSGAEQYDPVARTWAAAGSMSAARAWHTATVLPSGKVLVACGSNAGGYLASAELHDPASGSWTATAVLGTARLAHTATLLPSGKVLAAGGSNGSTRTASAELYDPAAATWSTTGPLATARSGHTATLIPSGKVLVAGGSSAGGSLRSAELYDPASGKWSSTGQLATAREHHTAILLASGKVLVAGGVNGSMRIGSAELYDPAAGTWTETGALGTARSGHTATLLPSGMVLVAGGYDGASHLAGAELYDPIAGTWAPTAPMSVARGSQAGSSHTATLLPSGKVLVTGGYPMTASAELYDPVAETWSATSALGSRRRFHAATLLPGGKVLISCGYDQTAPPAALQTAELYDPENGSTLAAPALAAPRYQHTATVLPSGRVLLVGGGGTSGQALATTELYDEGRGAAPAWTPLLSSLPSSALAGGTLDLGGALFTGVSEGSGGGSQSSPASCPLVLVARQDGGGQYWPVTSFTASTLGVKVPASPHGGWQWLRVVVNGVPSAAQPILVSPLTISPAISGQVPNGTVAFTAAGGSGSGFVWSLAASPSGGDIDAATGAYTAGPTAGGTDVVHVTDSLGNAAVRSVAVAGLSISPDAVTLPPSGWEAFTATGGSANGYVWTLSTNASGGSIDATTGAYTAGPTGGVTDVVRLTDALGNVATSDVTVTSGISISPLLAGAAPGGSLTFGAEGGSGSGFVWSLAASASGGSIDPTGAYTAGPTGGVTDVVQVTDSLGNVATRDVAVAELSISPATASVPPKGSQTFSAVGGSRTGHLWSLPTNASGGSIDPASGVYTAGATGGVTDVVRVSDSQGNVATRSVAVTAGVSISPAIAGQAPSAAVTLTATGGSGDGWTWSLETSPSGGSIGATTGVYTAGPTGGVTDVVRVSDSLGNVATLNVAVAALSISPAAASLPPKDGETFTAAGGSLAGYVWSLETNASGASIGASTGVYTAGPVGGVTDVVRLTDSLGNVTTRSVTVTAGLSISPLLAGQAPGRPLTFTAGGGSGDGFAWSLAANPSGGTIGTSTGVYTAGPTGGVTDVVRVTDSLGNEATRDVAVAALAVLPATPAVPPRGTQAFAAAGGTLAGHTWTLTTNASGATIDALTGVYTAGATGGVTDVVQVTDSFGNVASRSVSVTPGVSISPAVAGQARSRSLTFTATGGSGEGWVWFLETNASGGSIVHATGVYTAGATGGVTDVVRVTDSLGNVARRDVAVADLSISPAGVTLPPKDTRTFAAEGGSLAGRAWSISTNASGGTIDPSGVYTAGPVGGVTDVVEVTDSLGNVASASVGVTAGVSISGASSAPPRGSETFAASGGSGTGWTWSLATNASGGSIDGSTGVYTAGATGGVTDVVRVTDSLGNVAAVSVGVTAGVTISPPSAALAPNGTQAFAAEGGSGTGWTWSLATNASGGSIGAATGAYAAGGTSGVTDVVRVADSLGNVATANVTVGPPPPPASPGGGCGCGTGGGGMSVVALGLVALLRRRRGPPSPER